MCEETMMTVTKSDLISRGDAIAAFPKITLADIGFATKAEYRAEAIENINALPSADAAQGWTPCSEGLPDVGERCLVTLSNEVVAIGTLHSAGEREDDFGYIVRWGQRWHLEPSSMMIAYPEDSVIAWMPLPKPYRKDDK